MLFKSLICDDRKQQMTNKEILNILQKELSIDVTNTHELEVEIYMNIVKKFLKDWPEWDQFEKVVNELKAENDSEALMGLLEEKSTSLKAYLSGMLDIARLQMPALMKKLPKEKSPDSTKPSDKPSNRDVKECEIVMEVQATRPQLNNLFLRHPIGNNSIFNVIEPNDNLFVPNLLSLESILSSPGVSVAIRMRSSPSETFFFKYENKHAIRHKLVNRNLNVISPHNELSQEWQVKYRKKKKDGNIYKEKVLAFFKSHTWSHQTREWKQLFVCMHRTLRDLIECMPQRIDYPAEYRRYLSKYSFVRYLYGEHKTESVDDKYDIQLEETISPMCLLNINYFSNVESDNYVRIHCSDCKYTAEGMNIISMIKSHFLECHNLEQDWFCTNCEQNFNAANLMQMNWKHTCKGGAISKSSKR